MTQVQTRPAYGMLLRQWRERRRISQLDLASEAGVSARHISFVETGRSRPSREMVLRLADQLDVPLRDRNPMLQAAGFAPLYIQRAMQDPDMAPIREALDSILAGFLPYPALVVDRGWNLIAANSSLSLLITGAAAELLQPPVNVLRLSLHPQGLAERIVNLPQWRSHVLDRLSRDAASTADTELLELYGELRDYPGGLDPSHEPGLAVPLRMRSGEQVLSFYSTVTTFGTAVDITAAELSIEAFLPADAATSAALHSLEFATVGV